MNQVEACTLRKNIQIIIERLILLHRLYQES